MPDFIVLRRGVGAAAPLMIEPARLGAAGRPAETRVIGRLTVPMSTRLVRLSPPVLHVPAHGEVALAAIVANLVNIPGVIWSHSD